MEIKRFPESRQVYAREINKSDLYKMPYHGLFAREMTKGEGREYLAYVPECAHLSTQSVILFPDAGQDKAAFLEGSGWVETADERGIILIVADSDLPQGHLDTLLEDILIRDCMVLNKNFVYVMGYGAGAGTAQRMVMQNPVGFAGLVLHGEPGVTEEELAAMDAVPSEVPGVPRSRVPMPFWLITDKVGEGQRQVLDYWKRADRVQAEPYFHGGDAWYLPVENSNDSLIDELVGAKVRVSEGREPSATEIWDTFLSRHARFAGIGNGNLHLYPAPEEIGAEFRTMEVDGVRREWYQYVPARVRANPEKKVPLVFSFHGGGNMHLRQMGASNWVKVAEARGFVVAFPAAAMGGFSSQRDWLPHAAWNANANPKALNDEKFIRLLVNKLIEELPVDRGRVYSSGHSMGSAFGQRVLLAMPDVFAAAGLTSGVLRGSFFGDYQTPGIIEDHQRPIWIIMGERDIGGGAFDNNPDARKFAEYWTRRNETQGVDEPMTYRTGAYATKVYVNKKGVPMVQFSTVDNKFHSGTPQDSWFLYDDFLCKYSMDEEGRTVYMNSVVMD